MGDEPEDVAVDAPDGGIVRPAYARSRLRHRIQHRLQVGGRAGDDPQQLAGRPLLLQRFGETPSCLGELAGSLLEFAGPLVKLLLEIGCQGMAAARNRRRFADLARFLAARFHSLLAHNGAGLARTRRISNSPESVRRYQTHLRARCSLTTSV